MRFFHISDLHIGLRLLNRDMQPDQIHILDQIAEYVKKEQPDAVVIAGDIYDKAVPSAEAATEMQLKAIIILSTMQSIFLKVFIIPFLHLFLYKLCFYIIILLYLNINSQYIKTIFVTKFKKIKNWTKLLLRFTLSDLHKKSGIVRLHRL